MGIKTIQYDGSGSHSTVISFIVLFRWRNFILYWILVSQEKNIFIKYFSPVFNYMWLIGANLQVESYN